MSTSKSAANIDLRAYLMCSARSSIKIEKSKKPSVLPCGTPEKISSHSLKVPSCLLTDCFLTIKKLASKLLTLSEQPILRIFCRRFSCETLSKAILKSKETITVSRSTSPAVFKNKQEGCLSEVAFSIGLLVQAK